MTNYFVRKTGSDAAAGTSAGAAWATIGKALGAAGIASGDTVYIGAGRYGEVVTVAMTNPTVETKIIGDVTGEFTGDAGEVQWTAFVSGDAAAPSTSSVLSLSTRDFLTFERIVFYGGLPAGSTASIVGNSAGSTNCTFRDCAFIAGNFTVTTVQLCRITIAVDTPLNYVWERCLFVGAGGGGIVVVSPQSATAEWDSGIVVRDCIAIALNPGTALLTIVNGAASTFNARGGLVTGCSVLSARLVSTTAGFWSTATPLVVENCVAISWAGATGVVAGTSGHIVEDWNLLLASTPRSNVTAGANSRTALDQFYGFHWGQESLWGGLLRQFFMPLATGKALGFGGSAAHSSVDFLGRPRPAGGESTSKAAGALERHDTVALDATGADAGEGWQIVGPGDQDIVLLVDASSHTISVKARYDTNHAATNKPQALLLANPAIGVTAQTLTMTAAIDTLETLTFAAITPTAKGRVIIRLVSRSAAGNGIARFDTIAVN